MVKKVKGISERPNSYRARVSSGDIFKSKDFNFDNYKSKQECLLAAAAWLEEQKLELKDNPNIGRSSKFAKKVIKSLTQETLKEYIKYIPESGEFIWIKSPANGVNVGEFAGCFDADMYLIITIFNSPYKAHRLAFLYMEGALPDISIDIDHINRLPWDNRWGNLRKATRQQNMFNAVHKTSETGIKGLSIVEGKYRCNVSIDGQNQYKFFDLTETGKEIAIRWLKEMREYLHGEFANHG